MMMIKENIKEILSGLEKFNFTLIAVSKNHPASSIKEAYLSGIKDLGENKVQELMEKHPQLPEDIRWHMIGHLQRNKVKYIAPFVYMIHSVDSVKLLSEINKEGRKNNRVISCLLQMHIAEEESKFGFSFPEAEELLKSQELKEMKNIKIRGVMGMATNTENEEQIRSEFKSLFTNFKEWQKHYSSENVELSEISMGMSGDYKIALQEGSTMIRIGTAIFGNRNY